MAFGLLLVIMQIGSAVQAAVKFETFVTKNIEF
jgi:hypothetical protein